MATTPSADQLRNRPIFVSVPGTDWQIECRRPDPLALIAQGALPLETFAAVLEQLSDVASNPTFDNRPLAISDPQVYLRFIDVWACAAAVAPRLVVTEAEALADAATLWIEELELNVRIEIVRATKLNLASERLKTAVAHFRGDRRTCVGVGPDGAPVRDETVEAPAGV